MTRPKLTVWITQRALTRGIISCWVEQCVDINPDMVGVSGKPWEIYHGEGKEWHRTRESAVRRAGEMRTRKIASLKKQIAKLEKMTFDI